MRFNLYVRYYDNERKLQRKKWHATCEDAKAAQDRAKELIAIHLGNVSIQSIRIRRAW